MTTAQKTGLRFAAAVIAAAATVIFSAGMARSQLDGKEDRAAHEADMREINSALLAEQTARTLQQVRDSALMAVVLERVTDLACQQNPSRRYCR
jgi:hypothetical protein